MQRDNFTCQHCGATDKTLQVHHLWYSTLKKPWEYDNDSYLTLCSSCHELETEYNNILYTKFCDLKTISGQKGISKQVLDALFSRISTFLLDGYNEDDCLNNSIKVLLHDAVCGTQCYSDAKALERMGFDMTDYFLHVKTPNLNE